MSSLRCALLLQCKIEIIEVRVLESAYRNSLRYIVRADRQTLRLPSMGSVMNTFVTNYIHYVTLEQKNLYSNISTLNKLV